MTKQGAKTAVPRLRFPEFRGASTWKIRKLSSLADLEKGVQLSSLLKDESARYPHFNGGISNSSRTDDFNRPAHTIIISEGGNSCGFVQFIGEPFWCGGHCYSVTSKQVSAKRFLFFSLQARQKEIMELRVGSGLPNIPKHILERFEVAYSEEAAEQQKIADCLMSLDEVIAAQGRKVEALKAHKRGLMQQLFPREGETRPRLRFPEFRDAPEWENVAIEDLGAVVTGNTPPTSRQDYYGGGRPFVSPADISDLRFVVTTKSTLSEDGFAIARSIPAMSVLFVCIGSTIGKVAQNVCECATNQQINAIVANKGACSDFIYYLMSLESGRIAKLAGKQAVPIINKSLFSAVRIMAPKFGEQQRIADCLSSLDTRITAETARLAALKAHKQGLMQQLFPVPEGM